ncbi:hypothetical protein P154DRAFT_527585 [Amniculicola lignicola CBS 123094]|uniref:Calcineurin-like phosphoesterase domain-containing protein n=1 Tax=Amniculicola lignicola CBS 123094 TaxID=1392246 RepID=A0A6A5W7W0_9PLEO|nr:hypothetical protein P154DRAFT_527585 [Amniculicola lignicola CBS 123094]
MDIATFILLADPQIGWEDDTKAQVQKLSKLNEALSFLSSQSYPATNEKGDQLDITCKGLPIGQPAGVFIAGDLTNYGGHYNFSEQSNLVKYHPHNYSGGDILQDIQALYDPWHPREDVTQPSGCGKIYFGLGNHDFVGGDGSTNQWGDDNPGFGWRGFDDKYSKPGDFYRYQMWNFINQMHRGYHQKVNLRWYDRTPRFEIPADAIDCNPNGTFWWGDNSFNYVIDLGPVDVYQLHCYGGDNDHGRKSGLDWLKRKLAAKGYARPVVIVQHFSFFTWVNKGSDRAKWDWCENQRDNFLEVLAPYNIIALCNGHIHDTEPKWPRAITVPNARGTFDIDPKKVLYEFRPGSAMHQKFALFRVETPKGGGPGSFNVIFYSAAVEGQIPITWTWKGWNKSLSVPAPIYVRDIVVICMDHEDDVSPDLPTKCTEISGKSSDINKGFGGKYVYIRPLLTMDRSKAISSLSIFRPKTEDKARVNLATGAKGGFRYVNVYRDANLRPVTRLLLLRSDKKVTQLPNGFNEISTDINEGRGGDFLHLVWNLEY